MHSSCTVFNGGVRVMDGILCLDLTACTSVDLTISLTLFSSHARVPVLFRVFKLPELGKNKQRHSTLPLKISPFTTENVQTNIGRQHGIMIYRGQLRSEHSVLAHIALRNLLWPVVTCELYVNWNANCI